MPEDFLGGNLLKLEASRSKGKMLQAIQRDKIKIK